VAAVPGDTSSTVEVLYYDGHPFIRALTMLKRAELSRVAELIAMTPHDLRVVPGIGQVTFDLIRKRLHRLRFRLAGEK